jgi:peptidoglycan/xylan/chitin deacetylase (PgdA/CDA1 family)
MIICIHSQQQVTTKGGIHNMLKRIIENRKKQGEKFFPVVDSNKKENEKKKQK